MNRLFAVRTHRRCPGYANRQGLSLIEVVVMASVTSMMLVMVTSWIHQTMKQATRFRTERREQLAVSQLGQHFREHIWLSSAANLSDSKAVTLTNPTGDHFTYRLKDQQIHFTHVDASGKTQAFERFVVPMTSNVTFDRVNDSSVALKIETLAGGETPDTSDRKSRVYQVINPTLARWLPETASRPFDSRDESTSDQKELLE